MVEQVGQAELEEWLGKGEAMAYTLRREAGELLARSRMLLQYAKQIEAVLRKRSGAGKPVCANCGKHRMTKFHRENCEADTEGKS